MFQTKLPSCLQYNQIIHLISSIPYLSRCFFCGMLLCYVRFPCWGFFATSRCVAIHGTPARPERSMGRVSWRVSHLYTYTGYTGWLIGILIMISYNPWSNLWQFAKKHLCHMYGIAILGRIPYDSLLFTTILGWPEVTINCRSTLRTNPNVQNSNPPCTGGG